MTAEETIRSYLLTLAPLYARHPHEAVVASLIERELTKAGFDLMTDEIGNVGGFRGTGLLPLLNAHMDTAQRPDDQVMGELVVEEDCWFSPGHQIGWDDKAGIAIILTLARCTKTPFRVLFTVGEEVGSIGIQSVHPELIEKSSWGLTLDRKGSNDLITSYAGKQLASNRFISRLIRFSHEAGHPLEIKTGQSADTYYLAAHMECVNISAGYYEPHRPGDFLRFGEVAAIYRLVDRLLTGFRP
ncbi:MAG: hypothetical protein HUU10_12860 [Bacteroidetes bacterium]|nr:hypothetical protein [Bacteroidota bacterium]